MPVALQESKLLFSLHHPEVLFNSPFSKIEILDSSSCKLVLLYVMSQADIRRTVLSGLSISSIMASKATDPQVCPFSNIPF